MEEIAEMESRLRNAQEGLVAMADKYNVINRSFLHQRKQVIDQRTRPFPNPLNTPRLPDLGELWNREVKQLMDALLESNVHKVMESVDAVIAVLKSTKSAELPETKGFTLELVCSPGTIHGQG